MISFLGKIQPRNIMKSIKKIRIAFVHDDFIQFGGAERLILDIVNEFQNDENFEVAVYASIISKQWQEILTQKNLKFTQSFLVKIPYIDRFSKLLFFTNLYYLAFSEFNFDSFDIVFSSSTRYGHSVITKPDTFHISYINSPSRALWDEKRYFFGKKFLYLLIKNFLPSKRILDFYSQNYADLLISNSKNIARKVKKYYQKNSLILYPFLNQKETGSNTPKKDYFLIISRLVAWKRFDFVIETFNQTAEKLIVVGSGPEFDRYRLKSQNNIVFKGYTSDEEKFELLKNAKALIFPQNEDFGITLLESLSVFCPIIYLNQGGAKEILNPKVGVSFKYQNQESLLSALNNFNKLSFRVADFKKILNLYSKEFFCYFLKRLVIQKSRKFYNLV